MMDQIKSNKICALCVIFLSAGSLKSQNFRDFKQELTWKQGWMSMFFLEYRKYKEVVLPNCDDPYRDISFDIERKVRAVCDFPFKSVMSTMKKHIDRNSIKFDSILMVNIHSPIYEQEFVFPTVHFYIFKGNYIRKLVVYIDDKKNCSITKSIKTVDSMESLLFPLSGCGYGYISCTIFDSNWLWSIQKIVVNPDE